MADPKKEVASSYGEGDIEAKSMTEAAQKIQALGKSGVYGLGMRENGTKNFGQFEWYGYMLRSGTDFLTPDQKKPGLNTPELDDEFAKDLGHESVAALRTAVKGDLQRMVDSINADEAFDAITDKLVESHDFDRASRRNQSRDNRRERNSRYRSGRNNCWCETSISRWTRRARERGPRHTGTLS